MNWDALLHWMTHIGEGSWSAFRGAVAKLVSDEADRDKLCRNLRIILSDLGHADFFVGGSQRWRVLPPVLAGLPPRPGAAVLTGGRTPKLVARLDGAASARGCRIVVGSNEDHPAHIRVDGTREALAAIAMDASITYVDNFAMALCAAISPVPRQIENAPVEMAPTNWSVRSFDFRSINWVEGLRSRTACEFYTRYGLRRFYLHKRGGRLLRLPKREAVYAAAMLRGVRLAAYDAANGMLSSPVSAPLPESYSRAATLCAGTPSSIQQGRLLYKNVPPDVAGVLLVAVGQPYPELWQTGFAVSRGVEQSHGKSL